MNNPAGAPGAPAPRVARRVYAANEFSNTVTVFTLDGSGNITGTQPGTFTTGSNPDSVTVNPAGTRLYVANNGSNTVTVFTLDGSGNITGTLPGPFSTGSGSFSVAVY